MILGDTALPASTALGSNGMTIDDLFCRAAARRPEAIALADPPHRESFTDGPPRRLTYAEADRVVSAIAGRLQQMGLPTDAVIGIQLPNSVENVLTILGVLRAGMIVAPLPLLWRRADAVAALARVGAKALISCGRVGRFEHCQLATRVAAEVFSIRYVCGFGADLPDGVVAFDDLFSVEKPYPLPALERDGDAAAHLALISFEIGEHGAVPVARRHVELLAGALGILLESGLQQDATILSTIAPATFAGFCLTLMPWLLTGGTLALHHPFAADHFVRQRRDEHCGTMILPAPVAFRLAEAGLFGREGPTTIVAAWHAPEQLADSADWAEREAVLVDVPIFGEAGLIAARRGKNGRVVPLPLGPVSAPRDNGVAIAQLGMTATQTLALQSPMLPGHVFPAGIERSDQPHYKIGADGVVDTGYRCRIDAASETIIVTGSPSGVVNVGGYRFSWHGLTTAVERVDPSASLSASPDALTGQRLIGFAADPVAMRFALNANGLNPLVATAFAGRSERKLREAAAG